MYKNFLIPKNKLSFIIKNTYENYKNITNSISGKFNS